MFTRGSCWLHSNPADGADKFLRNVGNKVYHNSKYRNRHSQAKFEDGSRNVCV